MAKLATHDALIFLMVVVSAADRDMTDAELGRIGDVVRTWPVFEGFDGDRIVSVAKACRKALHEEGGMAGVFDLVRKNVPERLHDTAYALAFEVAAVDLEMRLEELRVLQLLRRKLTLDDATVAALERAAKARHRSLT